MPWWFWLAFVVGFVVVAFICACAVMAGSRADRLFESARRK